MEQPQFLEKDEVIRRLLIITEAVSKLPSNLLVSFNVNINVLDKGVREILSGIDQRVNSAYQAPFKIMPLDDNKGIVDHLLKELGFSEQKVVPIPKADASPPLPQPPLPLPPDSYFTPLGGFEEP